MMKNRRLPKFGPSMNESMLGMANIYSPNFLIWLEEKVLIDGKQADVGLVEEYNRHAARTIGEEATINMTGNKIKELAFALKQEDIILMKRNINNWPRSVSGGQLTPKMWLFPECYDYYHDLSYAVVLVHLHPLDEDMLLDFDY